MGDFAYLVDRVDGDRVGYDQRHQYVGDDVRGDVAEFAAGDMLAVTITAASAGCAATDLVVGIALCEA